jgi:hypothetical protein
MRRVVGPATCLAAAVSLGLLLLVLLSQPLPRRGTDHSQIPLLHSEYLKDVVEPISMVIGISWDDGGSKGLVFKDSRQIIRSVCLLDNLADEQNLIFGNYVPDHDAKRIPIGAPEEKAFLGLLERWYRQDPEARAWNDRMERSDHRHSILKGGETEEQISTGIAVYIMRKLGKRN